MGASMKEILSDPGGIQRSIPICKLPALHAQILGMKILMT